MAQKKYVSLTRLSNFLENIKAKYSQIGHKHSMSDLTDYNIDSSLSPNSTNPVQNKVLDAEFEAMATAMNALELAIDGKANSTHSHDDRYYTESEIDNKLNLKSDSTHNHDGKYDSKGSAAAVQTNLNAVSDTLNSHTTNADIHFTAAERIKLSGIAAGAQVNTITGVKGNSESTYRTGNVNITKANIGLGNVDNTADADKSVNYATSSGSATSATKATQDGNGKVISSTYETKTDASNKLTEAKSYADNAATTAANNVKNDLLNGAGGAYDTLKELGDLIDENTDAIDALETVASGKADKVHSHAISDVSGLQSALDGKAASSHGTHVSYSTTTPVMDGTASVGSASTVARSDHKHPTDTSRAAKTDLDSHTSNTTVHITATERTKWNNAYTLAESKPDSLSDLGVTASATELNYLDGVVSNIQTQLDERHTHWIECGSGVILSSKSVSDGSTLSSLTNVNPPDCIVVTFDNVEYKCVMWTNSTGENCYGDSRITTMYDDETGTLVTDMTNPENTPFYINACADDGADFSLVWTWYIMFNSNISGTSHTIKINEAKYYAISENFIPDTIARTSSVSQVQIITWEDND